MVRLSALRTAAFTPRKCSWYSFLLEAGSGPEGSGKLRFPDYMTTAQDGGKVVSLRVRVQCRQIQFQMQIPRVGTKNVLCLSVQVRIVAAGSLSQTVCRNDFLIPIGADFRILNLPALYAYPYARPPLPPGNAPGTHFC